MKIIATFIYKNAVILFFLLTICTIFSLKFIFVILRARYVCTLQYSMLERSLFEEHVQSFHYTGLIGSQKLVIW